MKNRKEIRFMYKKNLENSEKTPLEEIRKERKKEKSFLIVRNY